MIIGSGTGIGLSSKRLWTPAELITALWFDAADDSTISLNGSNVTQWDDKSGNNRHATQGTASSQPAYDSGNRKITFVDDYLDLTSVAADIARNIGDGNCFLVLDYTDTSSANVPLHISSGISGGSARFTMGYDLGDSNAGMQVAGRRLDSDSYQYVSNGTEPSGILIQHGNPVYAGSDAYLYINGSLDASSTSFHTDGNTSDTDSLAVRVGSGGGNQFVGDIYEILITGTLTTDQRLQIEGYLAHKWGLAPNLPGGHPYKNTPPKK